ncbi:hypothetical protein HPP92_016549 [Vanilla planifolia]|uniref:Adenylyl cyclase-associated protein n=1 Tax=Vanilla planifolia TaxID=51239 RepID=A0A835QIA9_VANPL|nr:hypothetical protein HPP92_016549 [Vanilla planifolia]
MSMVRRELEMEEELIERLEAAVSRLESLSAGSRPSVSTRELLDGQPLDPAMNAFDELVENFLKKVVIAAENIGGHVLEATKVMEHAFLVEKELLMKAKHSQRPNAETLMEFLKPLNELMVKANAMTEGKRSGFFNHLKAIADSLSALAWIAYSGKDCGMSLPTAHVEECWQAAEFYGNKVLVEYKSKGPDHMEWAKALKELYLPGLRDYVKNFYPLGPVWCPPGNVSILASSANSTLGRSPAAPPPPAAPLFNSNNSPRPKQGMSAVFEELNSSKSVTAGLRKVTDDMKSKNRTDRTGAVCASEKEPRANSLSVPKSASPKFELQMGRKWAIENQIGKKNLVINECDAKQSVYIYGCQDSVLQIKGKVNNITVDKCTKMGVLFKDVVAACEIVNSNGVEVQCEGSAPTITIDNTGGCQLYLSRDSMKCSITTAKSSEINVMVPGAGPESDWEEHALPQQFLHTWKEEQFVTSPVYHSGG